MNHTRAPLADAVRAYRDENTVPFTTPGHKRGRGITDEAAAALGRAAFADDIPLAGGVDDTHLSRGLLGEAERLAADAFGADRTFFLLNGSTIGNQAALLSVAGPGDEVIVARNFHKSMLAALILCGATPVYVQASPDPLLGVAHPPAPNDLRAALVAHPRARAVLLVSPSYFGVAADLPALARLAHAHGVPLIVDEAWGPHFPFHPALPPSAMSCGADAAVASIHKVLTGFTQSSILNLRGDRIDQARAAGCLSLLQTTSPSALILASIDACRRHMALHGHALLESTIDLANRARAAIDALPGLSVLGPEIVGPLGGPGAAAIDPTKLVIDVRDAGLSGYAVDAWLRERHAITVEMSDHRRIVALLSIADDEASVGRLVAALRDLVANAPEPMASRADALPLAVSFEAECVLTPRAAFFAPARSVALAAAAGEIAAEVVTPYPPGIPLLAPGERVTRPIVDYLRAGLAAGMHIAGPADPTLATLRVVAP